MSHCVGANRYLNYRKPLPPVQSRCVKKTKAIAFIAFNSAFEGGSVARDIWWTGDFAYSSPNKSGLQEVDLLEGRQLTVTNT